MQLIIDLPNREESLSFHRKRWDEVSRDRTLSAYQGRIETNAQGQIIMTPPAGGSHSTRQYRIAKQLDHLLGGQPHTECPVLTSDGVKAVDAGWYSDGRHAAVRGQIAFEIAPEICVEILSPSNTQQSIRNKFRLYFEAGAVECWVCDLNGRMTHYLDGDADTPHPKSKLCPDFPREISD
ncbi:MAG: Uma2 family endonuclease [Planctomycetota bacterium]